MRVVTARWLVRHISYAILVSFYRRSVPDGVRGSVEPDLMAVPMFALYLVSIVVAWLVGLRMKGEISAEDAKTLRLVVGPRLRNNLAGPKGPALRPKTGPPA
jgi:Sec-independent protein secretion pathway component TatC